MARKKQWKPEAESAVETPEVVAEPEPVAVAPDPVLSLDQAKTIVNDAVQPLAPGEAPRPRPSLELLEAAKAIVSAAVQPKAPA